MPSPYIEITLYGNVETALAKSDISHIMKEEGGGATIKLKSSNVKLKTSTKYTELLEKWKQR